MIIRRAKQSVPDFLNCYDNVSIHVGPAEEPKPQLSVSAEQSRAAWARLIKKVDEVDFQGDSRA